MKGYIELWQSKQFRCIILWMDRAKQSRSSLYASKKNYLVIPVKLRKCMFSQELLPQGYEGPWF